jgi:heme-degrading monooxygenase HmoA
MTGEDEMTCTYVWDFHAREHRRAEFEATYGPRGSWARLFRKSDGFLKTELLNDLDQPNRYITIDHWRSEADHARFLEVHRDAYDALDRQCEALTMHERKVGEFRAIE